MEAREVFLDGFERVRDVFHSHVKDLSDSDLGAQVDSEANSIAWLAWHLTRVQDDHVCEVAHFDQEWVAGGWEQRFGLALDVWDTGYGHKAQQVPLVRASADLLIGYHDDVFKKTRRYLNGLTADSLGTVVDTHYDPPVTLGARLLSVLSDDFQHLGQIGYIRGLLERHELKTEP
jgi:uncharacterized damage-inducible protein DinB